MLKGMPTRIVAVLRTCWIGRCCRLVNGLKFQKQTQYTSRLPSPISQKSQPSMTHGLISTTNKEVEMSWEELEDRTLWDITVNGSPLELVWVSMACAFLAVMYSIMRTYYWIKFRVRSHQW